MTMRFGKIANALTLGNLQGDQSKVQLSSSLSFIVSQGDNRLTKDCSFAVKVRCFTNKWGTSERPG
jgi:hypothetical protein